MDDVITFSKIKEEDSTGRVWTSVAIFINGKEIVDIIHEVELSQWKQKIDYIHQQPHELYKRLENVMQFEDESVEILCCICGTIECNSPVVHIRSDDDYVYWDKITHNQMQWVYNLTYKFNKKLYEIELEKLRSWQ